MEKQTSISTEITKAPRDWFKIISLSVLGVMIVPVMVAALASNFYGPDVKQAQLPAAKAREESARMELCLSLKAKGVAKLQDDVNGVLQPADLEGFDRNVTAQYRDMDCSKVKLNVSVDF